MALTAAERARRAYETSQRQHAVATLSAQGVRPAPQPGVLGAPQTQGMLGKGLTSATPTTLPQPFDPAFEAQKLGATWNTQIAGGEANYQRGQLAYDTGFNADGSVNASNPYSQATLLQDTFKRSQLGTNNSYAAQGQLYSGARLNAQATNDRGYAQGYDSLKRQTADRYHQVGFGELQSYGQNALGGNQADFDALRRAIYGT